MSPVFHPRKEILECCWEISCASLAHSALRDAVCEKALEAGCTPENIKGGQGWKNTIWKNTIVFLKILFETQTKKYY